jgi:hypothetical protein
MSVKLIIRRLGYCVPIIRNKILFTVCYNGTLDHEVAHGMAGI